METTRFGTIDIGEDQVIYLPSGLVGFPDEKRYILLEHQEGSSFFWFQSMENGSLAFVLIDPLLFLKDYGIEISPQDRTALELDDISEGIQTFVIVNISRSQAGEITANLLAPIVINVRNKLAKQIVLYQSPYSHRHPIPLISLLEK